MLRGAIVAQSVVSWPHVAMSDEILRWKRPRAGRKKTVEYDGFLEAISK